MRSALCDFVQEFPQKLMVDVYEPGSRTHFLLICAGKAQGEAAAALGCVNAYADRDGVLRSDPAIVAFEKQYFPSLGIQLSWLYLGITEYVTGSFLRARCAPLSPRRRVPSLASPSLGLAPVITPHGCH